MSHTLSFEITYKHHFGGWLNCWLTLNGARYGLGASYVFPPFKPLLYFVKAIAGQRLPARFEWDQEGNTVTFEATPLAEDSPLVHLKICNGPEDCWFDAEIGREAVIQAFLPPLLDFSQHHRTADVEWEIPKKLVEQVQQDIHTGIPPRSNIHAPQPVECLINGKHARNAQQDQAFFTISLENNDLVFITLSGENPFWHTWLNFLANIASASLPAECMYTHISRMGIWTDTSASEIRQQTRLLAEPLPVPEHFRLKIFTRFDDEDAFLLLDEVVERRQFIKGFTRSFRQYLNTNYKYTPHPGAPTPDLRTISLERLERV